eukprot:4744138-Amphidinium_carterae.1
MEECVCVVRDSTPEKIDAAPIVHQNSGRQFHHLGLIAGNVHICAWAWAWQSGQLVKDAIFVHGPSRPMPGALVEFGCGCTLRAGDVWL